MTHIACDKLQLHVTCSQLPRPLYLHKLTSILLSIAQYGPSRASALYSHWVIPEHHLLSIGSEKTIISSSVCALPLVRTAIRQHTLSARGH